MRRLPNREECCRCLDASGTGAQRRSNPHALHRWTTDADACRLLRTTEDDRRIPVRNGQITQPQRSTMRLDPALIPARTAVLSMDTQTAIVQISVGDPGALTSRAAGVLTKCREQGMTVIHIQVGFRPGLPEISSRNALFASIRTSPERQKLFQGDSGRIHTAVAPVGEDIVITKHRISAFTGTDLDMILRANEIDTLILFGIATSGVVLSTLLD